MRPSRHIFALCMLIFAVGNGCLSKSFVTQPEMTVDVVDEKGRPLESAEVRYYRWSNPHHRLDGEADMATDPAGKAVFTKSEGTETIAPLCMHGVPEHHISVCVKKEGHRTVVFELGSPESVTSVSVPLRAGETVECDFEQLRFPSGKKRPDIKAPNVSEPTELDPPPKTSSSAEAAVAGSAAAAASATVAAAPRTFAEAPPDAARSVTEARQNLGPPPSLVWGYVSKIYTCPPCPAGAQCKPCMANNVVLSEQDKRLDSYSLTGSDMIVFTKNPKALKLGARVVLEVEHLPESGGGKEYSEVNLVRIVSQ